MSTKTFLDAYEAGELEPACIALYGHEYWQVLSDTHAAMLKIYLGIDADDDPCGYCGTSQNPNDICRQCFDDLSCNHGLDPEDCVHCNPECSDVYIAPCADCVAAEGMSVQTWHTADGHCIPCEERAAAKAMHDSYDKIQHDWQW